MWINLGLVLEMTKQDYQNLEFIAWSFAIAFWRIHEDGFTGVNLGQHHSLNATFSILCNISLYIALCSNRKLQQHIMCSDVAVLVTSSVCGCEFFYADKRLAFKMLLLNCTISTEHGE
jgi:hypothetical protein